MIHTKMLSQKEINKVVFLFQNMNESGKHGMIATMMLKYPENFHEFIKLLGSKYEDIIPKA